MRWMTFDYQLIAIMSRKTSELELGRWAQTRARETQKTCCLTRAKSKSESKQWKYLPFCGKQCVFLLIRWISQ